VPKLAPGGGNAAAVAAAVYAPYGRFAFLGYWRELWAGYTAHAGVNHMAELGPGGYGAFTATAMASKGKGKGTGQAEVAGQGKGVKGKGNAEGVAGKSQAADSAAGGASAERQGATAARGARGKAKVKAEP
jgi:hypothetical protein